MSPTRLQQLIRDAETHHQAGRLTEAAQHYHQLCQLLPDNFDAWQLAGAVALQRGRPEEAAGLFARGLALQPRSALAAMRLGAALVAGGRAAEAEPHCRRATELDPASADAWINLASCLKTLDRPREAIDCHHRALALQPANAPAWHRYGLTLSLFGRFEEALRAHERALAADPGFVLGHHGRAQALQRMHRLPEAVAAYDRVLAAEPARHEARSYRLLALNHLDTLSREQLFAEHEHAGRAFGDFPVPAFPGTREPDRPLRIGLLSPDLRAHSCAHFLEPLLRHLDREQFALNLYHDHAREDAVSARLKELASIWRNFAGQPATAVEAAIRADAPDILIDLAGHTGATNRLPLFARHLAPVQINYLGYPNTTGLPAMHYRFTDAIADPEGEADALATEKLVRLAPSAWTYQPTDSAPPPNALPAGERGAITFGSCNNPSKINPTTAALWTRALAAVPGSRLLLKGIGLDAEPARSHLLALFTAAGLPAGRIDFAGWTDDTAGHLAHYHRIDIALDTFPYHGTTTTCEALWMGVPVVTLRGDRHAARVGASLLAAAGHAEWVAASADEFARIAAGLAGDRPRLAALRAGLRDEVRASPLCNPAAHAARFGAALRECWRAYCRK